ncbi:ribosome-recycling factor [Sporothrix stenoceras]|uniref:Ribosome-recycling factor n=1 Tax=Sporothrix stenoceras TaxID=5173 RepID=A0ABR3ZSC3_9PEZI
MRSIATVQTLAQRGTVGLVRPASAIASSRTLLQAANASPALRKASAPTTLHTNILLVASQRSFSQTAVQLKKGGNKKEDKSSKKEEKLSKKEEKLNKKEEKLSKKDKKDKKGGSSASSSSSAKDDAGDEAGGNHPAADPEDMYNFADVESRWQRSEVHHEEKFKELKRSLTAGAGGLDGDGAVDVDAIGSAPVTVKGGVEGEGGSAVHKADSVVPLSQLAIVIPRAGGRVVELRMHNPSSRKAITSAVQTNPLFQGQQPQPDPNDELVLLIKVGPVNDKVASSAGATAERTRRVTDLANSWREQIRKATGRRQKVHQQWKKDDTVRPDDFYRLEKELTKGQEKRMAKVDAAEKEALKLAEKGRR